MITFVVVTAQPYLCQGLGKLRLCRQERPRLVCCFLENTAPGIDKGARVNAEPWHKSCGFRLLRRLFGQLLGCQASGFRLLPFIAR